MLEAEATQQSVTCIVTKPRFGRARRTTEAHVLLKAANAPLTVTSTQEQAELQVRAVSTTHVMELNATKQEGLQGLAGVIALYCSITNVILVTKPDPQRMLLVALRQCRAQRFHCEFCEFLSGCVALRYEFFVIHTT